ncbi:MAG: GNAT family N-acetyltransferase [Hyphomicrobiaceae bacterium]
MAPPFVVRRYATGEAGMLRHLRLSALQETPEAFGVGYGQESARPFAFWEEWIAGSAPFGIFAGGQAAGLAGFWQSTATNLAHRGSLGAMFVAAPLRGTGAAAALVEAVLALARTCVAQVHLSVNVDNLRARRLYERLGFREYGREPAGLRYAGIDHDVLLMVRMLDRRNSG